MLPLRTARGGDHGVADLDVTPSHMDTPLNERVVAAINQVLEDERGSVLALVQLSAMATEALERHALVFAGGQAAQACIDLHALLIRYGAPVSERVGDAAAAVLQLERIDDRYLAFDRVQRQTMAVIESIPATEFDSLAQAALAMAHTVQAAHAEWALQRARDFATSREEPPATGGSSRIEVSGASPATEPLTASLSDEQIPALGEIPLSRDEERRAAMADVGMGGTAVPAQSALGDGVLADGGAVAPAEGEGSGS
jgi:hypothetical protein